MEAKISQKTELSPADIIRNRKGKLYRIETFHGDKNTFKISPWPAKAGEENPSYVIISRDTLVAKQWDKMDKDNIKLPTEGEPVENMEEVEKTEDESGTLFIKEEKTSSEENFDF